MIRFTLTTIIFLVSLLVPVNLAQTPAPSNGDYQSVASGNWEDPATWQKYNNGVWENAVDYPQSQTATTTAKINIQSGTTVTLTAPKSVRNLWLNGVLVTTQANMLTVLSNYSITGGSTAAYIDGPVTAQVASTAMRTLKFPIGKAGQGRPVEFTVVQRTTALTSYTAEVIMGAAPQYTLTGGLGQVSKVRYVRILKTGTNITNNAQIKLSYDTDDNVGSNNAQLRIAKNDLNANWVDIGGTGSAPEKGTILSTATALANFGNAEATGTIFILASTITLPKISGNAGLAGVELSYTDGTVKTVTSDASGNYSISVPYGWSGTVTPALAGYNFTPQNITYSNITQDKTAQNYTAASIYTDYRTSAIGSWEDPGVWEAFDGSGWIASPNYPIAVTGTVTLDTAAQIDLHSKLKIVSGGKLINKGLLNISAALTVDAGGMLVNEGFLENPNNGTATSPSHPGFLYVNGTYEHAKDGGMIGLPGNYGYSHTTWGSGSTCLVTGVIYAAPTVPTQTSMYSTTMVWNCPSQADDAFVMFNSDGYYTSGGFTLLNSNSHQVYLFSGQGRTLKNVVVSGPNSKLTAFARMSQGIEYLFFSYFNDLTVENGGEFYICTEPGSSAHYATINIQNNLTVSSDSKIGVYSNPAFSGISYSRFVFPVNPNKTAHSINTSGLIPVTGMDDNTNRLNFVISSEVILNSPLTAHTIDLNGRITSNGNLITILPGGKITGGSKTSFTDGAIAFQVASAEPAQMHFPLGKGNAGYYADLTVTNASADLTTFTAEMTAGTPPQNTIFPYLKSVASGRYFTISKSAGSEVTNAAVRMNYDSDDNISDHNLVRAAKNDGQGKWINLGGTGSAAVQGTVTSTVSFSDFTGSIFTLAKASAVPLNMISYWKLDEAASGSYADYLQVNNATGSSLPQSQGRVGAAQEFDGTSTKMSAQANASLDFLRNESFSVETWFKTATAPAAFQAIISRSFPATGANWYVGINPTNGKARFYISGAGQTASLYGAPVADNQWHHIAATFNGSTGSVKLYVDGALSASMTKSFSVDFASPTSKLEIASFMGGNLLKGILDELAFYNTELQASEVLQHYQNGMNGLSLVPSPEPVITSTPVTTATVGQLYSYDVNANGDPAPVYSLTSAPDNTMTIDAATGVIQWTPALAGDFLVTVKADNGLVPAALQTFTIKVAEAPATSTGMVSYWKFDEQTSGSYQDYLNMNNATGASLPLPHGKVGAAQEFDGVNTKVSAPANASLDFLRNESFSVETWFKTANAPAAFQAIISRSFPATGANWYVGINPTNGKARFYISGAGQTASLYGAPVTDNQWHHIAATFNGATGNVRLYVDGALSASISRIFNVDFSSPTSKLEIASFVGGNLLKGTLDELAFHNTEIPASEVLKHYQNGLNGIGLMTAPEPVITSAPVTTAAVGELYTYDVNASGDPAPAYSLISAPDETMTIDAATGVIQWTPVLAGDFQVTVKADNGLVPAALQTFNIKVAVSPAKPSGLISYWKLDEAASGSYADYLQVNNATGSSLPQSQGRVGAAQEFDGTSTKMSAQANASLDFLRNESFSVETWFKTATAPAAFQAIISRSFPATGANWYVGINPTNGKARFYISGAGQTASLYGAPVADNQWHHIAATFNGSTGSVKLYVDGALSASMTKSFSVDFASPTSKLEIASFMGGNLLKGILDELAFYNTELQAAEVLQHYQNGMNGKNYWNQTFGAGSNKAAQVSLIEQFTTTKSDKNVRLKWHARTDLRGSFELERASAGDGSWSSIGSVSSEGQKDFEYLDNVPNSGKFSYRVKFISRNGGYAFSDVREVDILPNEYHLAQNYPNPFNPATTISYELPCDSKVSLTVYNTLGEKVAEILNEVQSAGSYRHLWNASQLASGLYLLRMEAKDIASENSFSKMLKMMMVK